jgi:hypothetical protein
MAQWEAKFDWPLDQFLRERVQWPSERRVKCENGKLKRGEPVGIRILPETKQGYLARIKRAQREWVERQRQNPHPLSAAAEKKTCGERSRTMGHPQDQRQDQDGSTTGRVARVGSSRARRDQQGETRCGGRKGGPPADYRCRMCQYGAGLSKVPPAFRTLPCASRRSRLSVTASQSNERALAISADRTSRSPAPVIPRGGPHKSRFSRVRMTWESTALSALARRASIHSFRRARNHVPAVAALPTMVGMPQLFQWSIHQRKRFPNRSMGQDYAYPFHMTIIYRPDGPDVMENRGARRVAKPLMVVASAALFATSTNGAGVGFARDENGRGLLTTTSAPFPTEVAQLCARRSWLGYPPKRWATRPEPLDTVKKS